MIGTESKKIEDWVREQQEIYPFCQTKTKVNDDLTTEVFVYDKNKLVAQRRFEIEDFL